MVYFLCAKLILITHTIRYRAEKMSTFVKKLR
jgi:hypothetical protein